MSSWSERVIALVRIFLDLGRWGVILIEGPRPATPSIPCCEPSNATSNLVPTVTGVWLAVAWFVVLGSLGDLVWCVAAVRGQFPPGFWFCGEPTWRKVVQWSPPVTMVAASGDSRLSAEGREILRRITKGGFADESADALPRFVVVAVNELHLLQSVCIVGR